MAYSALVNDNTSQRRNLYILPVYTHDIACVIFCSILRKDTGFVGDLDGICEKHLLHCAWRLSGDCDTGMREPNVEEYFQVFNEVR